jgi:glycosyltransferase involved in cell wall biosynthesis
LNDLSIIIPALNEANNIGILLQEIDSAARELGIRFEILVIDGGSTDKTRETAAFASNSVRVLKQEKPGYGGALLRGFSSANATRGPVGRMHRFRSRLRTHFSIRDEIRIAQISNLPGTPSVLRK